MYKQTLKQAVHLATSGKSTTLSRALNGLIGCPVGGWGETTQALQRLSEALPLPSERSYTRAQFVEATTTIVHDRYAVAAVVTAEAKGR